MRERDRISVILLRERVASALRGGLFGKILLVAFVAWALAATPKGPEVQFVYAKVEPEPVIAVPVMVPVPPSRPKRGKVRRKFVRLVKPVLRRGLDEVPAFKP